MNLRIFLQETNRLTAAMTKEELEAFIHETARLLPENQRPTFLERLKLSGNVCLDGGDMARSEIGAEKGLELEFEDIMENLRQMEDGELLLEVSLNELYDDWYHGDNDEFIFSDSEGMMQMLGEAVDFIHRCIDCEAYEYGYQVADKLVGLKIFVEGDEWGTFEDGIGLNELSYYDISNLDYRKAVVEGLYLAYCANEMQEKPDALYWMIENSRFWDITLEEVMQCGEELEDVDVFLPLWISYLGKETGRAALALLMEALEMLDDSRLFLETARQFPVWHPSLYEKYLGRLYGKGDYEQCLAIGEEALREIDEKYVVRSHIAGILSMAAARQGRTDFLGKYWLEVFRSDTTVTNYLRFVVEYADAPAFAEEIQCICQNQLELPKPNFYTATPDKEHQENRAYRESLYMIAFLRGEFQYVRENAMNVSKALGWSSTFMKCGLAAFLLLFFEREELSRGMSEMCKIIISVVRFDRDDYQRYLLRPVSAGTQECFWECLKFCKERIEISEEEKLDYLQWMEKLIEKRVAGIMEASRRNYYGECASFVAALGEVLESRGEIGAKQRLLMQYRTMYSRRRAFHQELRAFGLVDGKNHKKKGY